MPMDTQNQSNFQFDRIAEAITFLKSHFQEQPSLHDLANAVHLSPFHLQRLFQEWAGTTPKKFLQYVSIDYARKRLAESATSLTDVAFDTGLSSTSRLHDLFVSIEGMTPHIYRKGGATLHIQCAVSDTVFGPIFIGATNRGVCFVGFFEREEDAFLDLKRRFPEAHYSYEHNPFHSQITQFFTRDWSNLAEIKLHLKGTPFQLKVWESLLRIPQGGLTTYGQIAAGLQQPAASRAVGSAVGNNPVAYLIPCHRVIQASGALGGYMWGTARKEAIIGWEAAQIGD